MDPFHERLARIALDAAASYGFCLAGGYAVQAHVHGVLQDGRYTGDELLRMAADHDPGFDPGMFADALRAVRRFPPSAFEPYKLTADQVDALCTRLLAWADKIQTATE
jgi:hypothetical protein